MDKFLVTEEYYMMVREKLRGMFLSIIAGFVIGGVIGHLMSLIGSGESSQSHFMYIFSFGVLVAGAPFVWKSSSAVPLTIGAAVIKAIASVLAGWLVTPIMLLVYFVQLKGYEIRYARMTKEKSSSLYLIIMSIVPVIFIILFIIAELSEKKVINIDNYLLIGYEVIILVTSILWVLCRSCKLSNFIDIPMDIFTMWFVRNYVLVLFAFIFGELRINIPYLPFIVEFIVFIDATLFVIAGIIKRLSGKNIHVSEDEINSESE